MGHNFQGMDVNGLNDHNIHLYRIFNEVARVGNITHAAKNLYISQPAVSSAITNLENSLGVRLFIRKSRGVQLTEKGELFYKRVKSAFDILEQGEFEIKQTERPEIGRLTIGLSTTMCHFVVQPFLKKFIEDHPYIDITLVNQSSYLTFKMLEELGLDIGVTTEPIKKDTLDYYPFMQYEYIFVATPTYIKNLKLREATDIYECFDRGTLMLLHKMHPIRKRVDQYFYDNGFAVGHTLEVSNMDLLIQFSNMGMGIGYVIRNFVQEELERGQLLELVLEIPQIDRTFGLTCNKTSQRTREMQVFIDDFKQTFKKIQHPKYNYSLLKKINTM